MTLTINNCPAISLQSDNKLICSKYNDCCENIEDCLVKRIIKQCHNELGVCNNCSKDNMVDCIDCKQEGKTIVSYLILQNFNFMDS